MGYRAFTFCNGVITVARHNNVYCLFRVTLMAGRGKEENCFVIFRFGSSGRFNKSIRSDSGSD